MAPAPPYDDYSNDHMINHPPHGHHSAEPKHAHPEDMTMPGHPKWAPCNDDQLPLISQVGRGIAGNGYVVRPKCDCECTHPECTCDGCPNSGNCHCCEEYYLEGYFIDGATGEETLDWTSCNISGGYLHDLNHTYRVRPWNDPPTFNLTFIYHKPPCCGWSWVTPNIPYCWDEKGPYPENMVGCGVATLFVRTDSVDHPDTVGDKGNPVDNQWVEKLVYPDNTTRENYNAPDPEEDWTVNLTFGLLHGDVLVPNLYDLAEVIGFGANETYNVADSKPEQFQGGIRVDYGHYTFPNDTSDDLKHYIDENDRWLLDHFHKDLGFPEGNLPGDGDGGGMSVKQYIDSLFEDLFKKIYWGGKNSNPQYQAEGTPAGKVQDDGTILWTTPADERIAVGNMNLYGGSNMENWIRTDDDGDNDVKAM